MFKVPEKYRVIIGPLKSSESDGNNGCFTVKRNGFQYNIIATDFGKDEHVSVHITVGKTQKTPTWEQMCFVKDLFWGKEDTVVQYHPPESQYVNVHEHVLHLWRTPTDELKDPLQRTKK
jgi:hypothetical protein